MTGNEWLAAAGFGAVFGVIGQLIRTIGGLKKVNDASAGPAAAAAEFSSSRWLTSVAIGGVAGALAALSLEIKVGNPIETSVVLGLMAAGYAGADFIEAFMHKQANAVMPRPSVADGGKAQTGAGAPAIAPNPEALG